MPLFIANFKDGEGYKYKYIDISTKILSQEMLMRNMEALIFINVSFLKKKYSCKILKL